MQQDGVNYAFVKQQQEVEATDTALSLQITRSVCWNRVFPEDVFQQQCRIPRVLLCATGKYLARVLTREK